MQTLSEGSYFEVGSQHNRKVYRVMKVYKHTIHTINIKEPLTVRIIKHFEATYSQEIYDLKIINKQEGDSLFLAIIEERINLFIELKKEFNIIKEEMPQWMALKQKKIIKLKQHGKSNGERIRFITIYFKLYCSSRQKRQLNNRNVDKN